MANKLYCCPNQAHDWELIGVGPDRARIGCKNCEQQEVRTIEALPPTIAMRAAALLCELRQNQAKDTSGLVP